MRVGTAFHLIVAACFFVFFSLEQGEAGRAFVHTYALQPYNFGGGWPSYLSPLASVFMHRDAGHLILNLALLWVLTWRFNESRGLAYLALFALAGTVGHVAQAGACLALGVHTDFIIGASGAVYGLVGAHLRNSPALPCPFVFFGRWVEPPFVLGVAALAAFEVAHTLAMRGRWAGVTHLVGLGVGYLLGPMLAGGVLQGRALNTTPGLDSRAAESAGLY